MDIYLTTLLSSSYVIIIYRSINTPVRGNNFVGVLNATEKRYLKEQMEIIGKLASNDTSNIGIVSSDSKYVFIKSADKCIPNFNNKGRLNGIKGRITMQNISSLLKYQSLSYIIQRNNDVKHRGMKMLCNNKLFILLNYINVKLSTYGSKGAIIHCHYRSDPKLGQVVVSIIIITFGFHACTTILSLPWYSTIK